MPPWAIPSRSTVAIGFALWLGFIGLFFGAWLSLCPAPWPCRRGGIAGIALAASWVINGLNIGAPVVLSPFAWTFDHIPLVGIFDWASVRAGAGHGRLLLAIGIELFQRRDLA